MGLRMLLLLHALILCLAAYKYTALLLHIQARTQGGFEGVRTNPPFRLDTYVIYSHLARLDCWPRLRPSTHARKANKILDRRANATLHP